MTTLLRRGTQPLTGVSLVAILLASFVLPLADGQQSIPITAIFVVATVAALVAVLIRLVRPRSAVAVAVAATLAAASSDGQGVGLLIAVFVTIYTVGSLTTRSTTVSLAVVAVVAVVGATLVKNPGQWDNPDLALRIVVFIGFAAATGQAVQNRRGVLAASEARLQQAENDKEKEAQRRVTEERLRIARDLHDVIAHQIAVINMHANLASRRVSSSPDKAEESLATIREAARDVLSDIGGLLTLLRSHEPASLPAPLPGMAELSNLLRRFDRLGFVIEPHIAFPLPTLAPLVDVVAFQVIQEGLTNAHKHGLDQTATLQIEADRKLLRISVTNLAGMNQVEGKAGYGLQGVGERVAAVEGSLTAERGPGPVFRFEVELPTAVRSCPPPEVAVRP